MVSDISGFGTNITIIASKTYPVGINITQFSDDADAVDMPAITIANTTMGLNGDLIVWSSATPLPVTLSVIAGSADDVALGILADANRVAQGKLSVGDIISLTTVYPDLGVVTFTNGKLVSAQFGRSVTSGGRVKTKVYSFMFQGKVG